MKIKSTRHSNSCNKGLIATSAVLAVSLGLVFLLLSLLMTVYTFNDSISLYEMRSLAYRNNKLCSERLLEIIKTDRYLYGDRYFYDIGCSIRVVNRSQDQLWLDIETSLYKVKIKTNWAVIFNDWGGELIFNYLY